MTDQVAFLKRPLQLAAAVFALFGVALLFKSGGIMQGVLCFAIAAAALFAAWFTTAPPPREREGMLDGLIDDSLRRPGETEDHFERRKTLRRFGKD